jgi:hypothetical protein
MENENKALWLHAPVVSLALKNGSICRKYLIPTVKHGGA